MSSPSLPNDFSVLQERRRLEERLRQALQDADHQWRPLQEAVLQTWTRWLADPCSDHLQAWTAAELAHDHWWIHAPIHATLNTLRAEREALHIASEDELTGDRDAFIGFEAREDHRLAVALKRAHAGHHTRGSETWQRSLREREAELCQLLLQALKPDDSKLPESEEVLVPKEVEEAWQALRAVWTSEDAPPRPTPDGLVGLGQSDWQRIRVQAEAVTRPAWLSLVHAQERSSSDAEAAPAIEPAEGGTPSAGPSAPLPLMDADWFQSVDLHPWLARVADGLTFQSRDILENISFTSPLHASLGSFATASTTAKSTPQLWIPETWTQSPLHLQDLLESLGEALSLKYQPHHTPTFAPSSLHPVQIRTVALFMGMLPYHPEFYRLYMDVPIMEFTALQRPLRIRAHAHYVKRLRMALATAELFEDLLNLDDPRSLEERWADLWRSHPHLPMTREESRHALMSTLLHFLHAPEGPFVELVSLLAAAQLHVALEEEGQESTVDGLFAGASLCRHWLSPGEETPWPVLLESLSGRSLTLEAFQRLFLRT